LQDLIESENPDLASREVVQSLDVFFDQIITALESDGRVEIRGFGSFSTRTYGARTARNPRNGAVVDLGERRLPFFKPSSVFATRLRGEG
jgi:integration host factor subunit beta